MSVPLSLGNKKVIPSDTLLGKRLAMLVKGTQVMNWCMCFISGNIAYAFILSSNPVDNVVVLHYPIKKFGQNDMHSIHYVCYGRFDHYLCNMYIPLKEYFFQTYDIGARLSWWLASAPALVFCSSISMFP